MMVTVWFHNRNQMLINIVIGTMMLVIYSGWNLNKLKLTNYIRSIILYRRFSSTHLSNVKIL